MNKEPALAATTTTMPVMEAAEKEVAVKVGWLEKSIPNTRHEGEGIWLSSRSQQEQAAAPTP